MQFRFIGQYTGGRTTINPGVLFVDREPSLVTDAELARRLSNNPEFERVGHPLDHDGDGKPGGSLPDAVAPRRRGRKKKVQDDGAALGE